MTHATSRHLLPAEEVFLFQASPLHVVDRVTVGQIPLRVIRFSPVSVIPMTLRSHLLKSIT